MIKISPFLLVVLLLLSGGYACQRSQPSSGTPLESPNGGRSKLNLKVGTKIVLSRRMVDPRDPKDLEEATTSITVASPVGAEGLVLFWNSSSLPPPDNPDQEQNSPSTSSTGSSPIIRYAPATPYPLSHQEGKLTLTNISNARRMTFPILWPQGELYLANTSAIWLSDVAFEELKRNRKTQWDAGLLPNSILGPLQDFGFLENALKELNIERERNPEKLDIDSQISAKRWSKKLPLIVNGKKQEVEILEAENGFVRYKILNNSQDPLILEVTLAPEWSPGEILFSPVAFLKGLLEYRVLEIDTPGGTSLTGSP